MFGPIFNDTHFLKPLLELQKSIENLTATVTLDGTLTTVTLKDICFQPLVQSDVCTIQSIWGYYQDNETIFDEEFEDSALMPVINRTENYLDHFIACAG